MEPSGNRDDQYLWNLRSFVGKMIRRTIRQEWLHNTATPDVSVHLMNVTGATDAMVFEAHVQLKVFVKMHAEDIEREARGYELLRRGPADFTKYLIPPLTNAGNEPILWLTPLIEARTLQDLIVEANELNATDHWIGELYTDFLSANRALWLGTLQTHVQDYQTIYSQRVRNRLPETAAGFGITARELDTVELVIGNRSYGEFGALRQEFERRVSQLSPGQACVIHGDEHAKNIMVFHNAVNTDKTGWGLIDFVNATAQGDWIFSLAKMVHWWDFYCVVELAKSNADLRHSIASPVNLSPSRDRLILNYDEAVLRGTITPTLRAELLRQIEVIAKEVGQQLGQPEVEWRERLNLALFSVVFASAFRHFEVADFAVPVMIGKSLDYLKNGYSFPQTSP